MEDQEVFLNLFGDLFGSFCLEVLSALCFEVLFLLIGVTFLSAFYFENLTFDFDLPAYSFFLAYDRVKIDDFISFFYFDFFSLLPLFYDGLLYDLLF